jgi:DNA polymerase-3 subunit epsilon
LSASTPLLARALAVIDVQVTGLHPAKDCIWEIAVLQVEAGAVVARHTWLLKPDCALPASVSRLCGVLPAELDAQPAFNEIAAELANVLEGRVVVGHNLRIAHAFLRRAFATAGQPVRYRQLCTLQLARAAWSDLSEYGLDALCEAQQISRFFRHRALPDAEAVWQLLTRLLEQVPADFLQRQIGRQLRKAAVPRYLSAERLQALPARPGVYYFYGENQALLYIGKSRNLRQRVQSHFQNDHHSRRSLQVAQQIRDIRVQPTAGELGALLLEAAEVKRLLPLYNRQLRRQRELLTWVLEHAERGWRVILQDVDASAQVGDSVGLFRSRRQAQGWLRSQARQHQLCLRLLGLEAGAGACFATQLGGCKGACCGQEPRAAHDARLLAACEQLRVAAWPWPGAVALVERDPEHGFAQWHVLDQWRYLATVDDPALIDAARQQPTQAFSLDAYHIVLSHLRRCPHTEVVVL